ncbi:hypothetical protein LTR85_011633 [Meristemomyces frigidus]|nr:hypothetical protein LTR85_011633 [Meristemomyces frigidus]
MAAKSPIVLILGAGSNIGQAVARTFASEGYKVALAARSLNEADSTNDHLNIASDFSTSDDVVNAFSKVEEVFGIPSVAIYNVSAVTFTHADDPFAISLADFSRDTTINIHSAFGVGKSGAAHMIWAASAAYQDRGYKFYYADDRKADGSPKYRVSGPAHADLYLELAQGKTQGPWMQTFVQGVGYTKFDSQYAPLT